MEKQEGSSFELVNSQVTATHHIINKEESVIFINVSQQETVDQDPGLGQSLNFEDEKEEAND